MELTRVFEMELEREVRDLNRVAVGELDGSDHLARVQGRGLPVFRDGLHPESGIDPEDA